MPVTRFAPSPTGQLHLGHAFAARVAHDLACRHAGGRFLLRFEDIDAARSRPEFQAGIEHDLRWLGLDWDGPPVRQSDRLPAYHAALDHLRTLGVAYPCFCSRREIRAELDAAAAAPHGPDPSPYPGTCRHLHPATAAARLAAGHPHAWRLDAAAAARRTGPLSFTDQRHGTLAADPFLLGDVVLARRDAAASYHLAVVVDDAFQQVDLVTRGEDLLASTHVHRLLQQLLGLPAPRYHHHPLVTDAAGRRLAKRDGALAIATLRRQGLSPAEVWHLAGPGGHPAAPASRS